jgi:hypothetical protein
MTDSEQDRIIERGREIKAEFITAREIMAAHLGEDPNGLDFHNAVQEDMAHKLAVQEAIIVELRRRCDILENRVAEAFAK